MRLYLCPGVSASKKYKNVAILNRKCAVFFAGYIRFALTVNFDHDRGVQVFYVRWTTDPDGKKMLKQSLDFVAVGIEMGVSVAIGILGGSWADSHFKTEPILFWVGFGIGLGAAAKAVVDAARKVRKELDSDDPESTKKS